MGGLDSVVETTLNLPNIKGGKKLIYTHISMPLTAIADFEKLGETDPMFKKLAEIVAANERTLVLSGREIPSRKRQIHQTDLF